MGYYSDVVIAVKDPLGYNLRDILSELELDHEKHLKDGYLVFVFPSMKWYDDYDVVATVMEFIHTLNEDDYGYIRVGEDTEDIEILGTPWLYNVYTSTSIIYG
jgi:hypothetical protein